MPMSFPKPPADSARPGDRCLTRSGAEVTVTRIYSEDGNWFAGIRYVNPADQPDGLGYLREGEDGNHEWEHSLVDRETWSTEYHTDASGELQQTIVTGSERGLRPAPDPDAPYGSCEFCSEPATHTADPDGTGLVPVCREHCEAGASEPAPSRAVLTNVVETVVLGVRAYHVECQCGFKTKPVNREARALARAKVHGEQAHGASEEGR